LPFIENDLRGIGAWGCSALQWNFYAIDFLIQMNGKRESNRMTETNHEFARRALAAHEACEPMPLLSDSEDPILSRGYELQRAYVDLLLAGMSQPRHIRGFKAALTNTPAQQSMGMTTPAGGVLVSGHEYPSPCQIRLADFCRPIIETEIGYRISRAVTHPVSLENLNEYIDCSLPMVEIADAGYATPNPAGRAMSGADLVAANSAAGGYIIGLADLQPVNPDDIEVTLHRGDEALSRAHGRDAMGSQAAVLVWLINHSLAQGYAVLKGHYLMTGSLGRVQLATPGHYIAQYMCDDAGAPKSFGRIEFDII